MTTRETMEVDVVIVGAGPAGLSSAIRLAQYSQEHELNLNICVIEKGAEVGAHILSGAVLDPQALDQLLPKWRDLNPPIFTPVIQDKFYWLGKKSAWRLPTPPQMRNHGNYIISLSSVCRWLAEIAESLGVQIFPGFAASEILYDNDKVVGIATGDMGVSKNGEPSNNYQPGINLKAKYTIICDGCRGNLSKELITKFSLAENCDPQTYALGIKEVWEIDKKQNNPGEVIHTIGWPLDNATYGGSFVYHLNYNKLAIGFVVGLDYQNPFLSPYEELQRFKHHPLISKLLTGGRCIAYGARSLNEGGWQSIPKLSFPGGVLAGCSAGFINVPKIKGIHNAMYTGMYAGDHIAKAIAENDSTHVYSYDRFIRSSTVGKELKKVRNIRPAFTSGLWFGLVYSAIDTYLLRGHSPWTMHHHYDHLQTKPAKKFKYIDYPKPDGKISFDRLTNLQRSGTYHNEDQPCHLQLAKPEIAITVNFNEYQSPEQRFCPAGVYEIINPNTAPQLQINAQNCLHCKACDIKDIMQNITWVPPEGGGGPKYTEM